MARIKKEETLGADLFESVAPLFRAIFTLSSVVTVVSLGYLLYALFIVKVGNPSLNQISSASMEQIAANLRMVGGICVIATAIFAVSVTLAHFENRDLILYMGALGFGFWFGFAFLVDWIVGQHGGNPAAPNAAVGALALSVKKAGMCALVVALLRGAVVLFEWIREGPSLRKPTVGVAQREKASVIRQRKMNAASPCWQLPYCRDSIRDKCPAFVAKKRCWKFGRGCYCDEQMIQSIVSGMDGGNTDSYAKAATTGITKKVKPRSKPPCGKCYIFLEHQNLKYKFMGNFIVPAAVLVCIALWKPYTTVYDAALVRGQALWERMAFSTKVQRDEGPSRQQRWAEGDHISEGDRLAAEKRDQNIEKFNNWARVFVMVVLAMFVLIYLSKALEFAVFRLHL